jgi:hypothetical protein
MNLIVLARPPKNIASYVLPPVNVCTEEEIEEWLRTSLSNGEHDLHVQECSFETISHVHALARQENYKLQYLPIIGKTAHAEFFLERAVTV